MEQRLHSIRRPGRPEGSLSSRPMADPPAQPPALAHQKDDDDDGEEGASPVVAGQVRQRRRRRKDPGQEEWAAHMPTIKRLYMEEKRPLKQVMEIMARDYGFVRIMKAYKARLKQDGLLKNITLKSPEDIEATLQVLAHAQEAATRQAGSPSRSGAAAATTITTITTTSGGRAAGVQLANGHVVTFERLAVHLRRKRMLVDHHAGHYGAGSSPWAPSHLGAPGPWRTAQQIFAKSWEYKARRLKDDPHGGGGGRTSQGPPVVAAAAAAAAGRREEAIDYTPWYDTVMYARDLLRQGHFADAVALLRLAPAQLTQMLRAEPPAALDLILGPIFSLISAAPQGADLRIQMVVKSLVRYLAAASAEMDGLSPDLRAVVGLLSRLSTEDGSSLYETAIRARKCMLDLEGVTYSSNLPESMLVAHKWCRLAAIVGYEHLPAQLEARVVGEYEKAVARFGKTSREAALPLSVLAQLYRQRSVVHADMGESRRAQQAVSDLLEIVTAETAQLTTRERLSRQRDLCSGMSSTYFMQGQPVLAEKFMRRAISDAILLDGEYSDPVFRIHIQLRGFFKSLGNQAGASEMEGQRQRYLHHLREQVRASENDPRAEARYVTALHATWPSATMFTPIGMEPLEWNDRIDTRRLRETS